MLLDNARVVRGLFHLSNRKFAQAWQTSPYQWKITITFSSFMTELYKCDAGQRNFVRGMCDTTIKPI